MRKLAEKWLGRSLERYGQYEPYNPLVDGEYEQWLRNKADIEIEIPGVEIQEPEIEIPEFKFKLKHSEPDGFNPDDEERGYANISYAELDMCIAKIPYYCWMETKNVVKNCYVAKCEEANDLMNYIVKLGVEQRFFCDFGDGETGIRSGYSIRFGGYIYFVIRIKGKKPSSFVFRGNVDDADFTRSGAIRFDGRGWRWE